DDAAGMLRARLDEAVAAQMTADAPLGAFLSGGVDSAGVVASMRQRGGRLVTFTVGFKEDSHDERAFSRAIAQKFGAEHHEHVADID
ncbi:asparagine synthase-related protein, partial [Salmonella enterica]|uniref:asparagine synthase-related protein n=1 Tax=Salmonella enterica TaxID=28901 RepID=UPI0032984EE8